ncbi:MAG: PDZ domain-containing protein [Ruminococcaceae bacterium]|nr:PDZ domain-containing protein [Oscillospiraceae bacterium]
MSDFNNDLFSNEENGKEEKVENNFETSQQPIVDGEYHYKKAQGSDDAFATDDVNVQNTRSVADDNSYSSAQWSSPYSQPQYSASQQSSPQYTAPQYSTPQYNTQQTNPYSYNPPIKPKKEKKGVSKGFVAFMLILCVLLSSGIGFGGAMLYTKLKVADAEISTNGAMVINKVDIDEETAEQLSDKPTSQITEEVADTVVEITTEVMTTNSFYGQYISQGAGSGVIISSDGYIVTNNHVIEGATSITVTLRDKTSYEAKLVGTDSIVDVALLKVEATGLKAATFGDSDKLKVGDKAVAIGNPLGQLGGTVTDGIISALDRDVVIDEETMNLLQTDTAINPGNSGGGLFDGQGALVGVVVAKSSGEEIEGLGFAIPINDVIDILDDLKEYGYVRGRVSVGMELIDLTNSMYSMYYYGNAQEGCYVYSVSFDSAAYKAGIQQGDRIVSVDSKEITSSSDVEEALDEKKVSDKVKFELERGGRTATVELTLEEYIPQEDMKAQQNNDDIFNPFA